MNFLKYFFVSGESFFYGDFLIILATVVPSFSSHKRLPSIAISTAGIGFLLVFFSTTPAAFGFYLAWFILILLWAVFHHRSAPAKSGRHFGSSVLLILVSLAGIALEYPYWKTPVISGDFKTIDIVGDSISSGIGREKLTWPAILQQKSSLKVTNLAVAGAKVASAITQAQAIKSIRGLVILEIGGNDLLQSTSALEFENGLRALLLTVQRPGRKLVMFELPLFPFRQSYGKVQRQLAGEFNVILIPKRFLAGILLTPDGTVDGLHLSDAGHQQMADLVWSLTRLSEDAKPCHPE